MINRGPSLHRPYDPFVPPVVLRQAKLYREEPKGDMHAVVTQYGSVDGKPTQFYPWDRMNLGDHFIAPIRSSNEKAMRVRFRHVAARRGWELTVRRIRYKDEPCLIVTLSMIDITPYKQAAVDAGVIPSFSDGRWYQTRKARREADVSAAA